MRTRLTLHPTQDGAKQLYDQYSDRLMCVRYRYDETTKRRWKTVELIIEESPWEPPPRPQDASIVALRVAAQEREVRRQVKAVGGKESGTRKEPAAVPALGRRPNPALQRSAAR